MNDWVTKGKRKSRGKALAEKKHFLVQVHFERAMSCYLFSKRVLLLLVLHLQKAGNNMLAEVILP